MNKNNKVLLSTIGLLLLSGIAATSSTFAWFTTVRSASINYGEATIGSTEGNLVLGYVGSMNDLTDPPSAGPVAGNTLTLAGTNSITDISGDGKTFWKPIWVSQTGPHAGVASSFTNVSLTADGNFIDFTITVARDNTGVDHATDMKVYLGAGTIITALTGGFADANALAATRLAVLNASGNPIFRWAPVAETNAANYKYIAQDTESDKVAAYGVDTHYIVTDTVAATAVAGGTLREGPIPTNYKTPDTADAGGFQVAYLTEDAPSAQLTFRVWIEGEDLSTTNTIKAAVISLAIDLYGLDVI